MIWRWSFFQYFSGKIFFRSFSVCMTLFPEDSPHRLAHRWMWVSTGKAGFPKAWVSTTEAVLWPTPGRASSSSSVLGTFPLWWAIRSLESCTIAFAFVGPSPHVLMMCSTFFGVSCAIFCGVSASAKRAGVTRLTRASVHCAERRTAIRRV